MAAMDERSVRVERAQNLWQSLERKFGLLSKAAELQASPEVSEDRIGGLAIAKEEVLTYACAATNPDVYATWGTVPPTAMLLIGDRGVGKSLLVATLATRTETAFLRIDVPTLVIELVHRGGRVGELFDAWFQTLSEMPPTTVFFDELEFSQAQEIGARRPDLPAGPIMDFLLELVDRSVAVDHTLVVGSTAHPDTLRHAFLATGRFERVVEVSPVFPEDIVEALRIHAADAEKRAGRPLFSDVDWNKVVLQYRGPSPGEWIRLMHAVLRRKARCDAAGEKPSPVTTPDLLAEVERFRKAATRLRAPGGIYL